LILDTVTRGRWEAKRMAYLAIPGAINLRSGPAQRTADPGDDVLSRIKRQNQP
jgi:hypothetical protein